MHDLWVSDDDRVSILTGDSVECLKALPDESIHLCVTSPPYDELRTYGRPLAWDFEGTAKEIARVLTPGGIICWNIADQTVDGSETLSSCKQKIFFREACGLLIHDTMIYERLNFSHPEKVRYHNMFEYVFILSKGAPRVFNPIKDRKNISAGKVGSLGVNTYTKQDGQKAQRARKVNTDFGMRGNVWRGKTRGQEEMCKKLPRTSMMPKWLARDLIISWSNPGDVVLDPFAGSGTTGYEAQKLNRDVVLIDLDKIQF